MCKFQTLTMQALAISASLAVLTACGGGDDDPAAVTTTTTSATTSSTAGSTTTTTTTGSTTTTTGQVQTNAAQFMASHSFLCMDEGTNSAVVQSACFNNVPSQAWKVTSAGDSNVTLTNLQSNKCLTIAGAATTDLALAVTGNCDGSTATKWTVTQNGGTDPNRVKIVNANSGKCLEIAANSATAGTQFSQFTCGVNPQPNQTFVRTVLTP